MATNYLVESVYNSCCILWSFIGQRMLSSTWH